MIAKGSPIAMAGFELLMGLFWWAIRIRLVDHNGAVGATPAYALHYAVYVSVGACTVALILRRMAERERQGVSA